MVLELLVTVLYETVQHSWAIATVALKYVLLVSVVGLGYRRELDATTFIEIIEKYSRETVTAIVVLGFLFAMVDTKPEPVFRVLSEIVALAYFAFLFWRF